MKRALVVLLFGLILVSLFSAITWGAPGTGSDPVNGTTDEEGLTNSPDSPPLLTDEELAALSELIDEAVAEIECDKCEDGESRIFDYQYPDPDPDGEDDDESCLFPPPPGSRDGSGEDPLNQEAKEAMNSDGCTLCESKSSCHCEDGICKRRVKVCIRKPSRDIWAL